VPGSTYSHVLELALDQHGYFSVDDAKTRGVSPDALAKLVKRGQLERIAHGLYRVPVVPPDRFSEYMQWALWPGADRGVICGQSTLAMLDLSDVNPDRVHVAVPPSYRTHREIPRVLALHHVAMSEEDRTTYEAVPSATAGVAIRQCHAWNMRPDLLWQAIEDAARSGFIPRREAAELRDLVSRNARPR
jgi:predicted transcriptional regulator of viral defense system